MLASIDLLVAVLLAIALGISTGYMISGHDRFARRVVSPVFRISVILLVFVLGFSGGSSMARYEYISTFYIFLIYSRCFIERSSQHNIFSTSREDLRIPYKYQDKSP
ncbi:MAG: hypothetical protein RQ855_08415 [Desulfurococcales archaeon]|nr:hypothetical protein [Desulfurococcales archaeon]